MVSTRKAASADVIEPATDGDVIESHYQMHCCGKAARRQGGGKAARRHGGSKAARQQGGTALWH